MPPVHEGAPLCPDSFSAISTRSPALTEMVKVAVPPAEMDDVPGNTAVVGVPSTVTLPYSAIADTGLDRQFDQDPPMAYPAPDEFTTVQAIAAPPPVYVACPVQSYAGPDQAPFTPFAIAGADR